MAPEYGEVTASGRRYSRNFILQHLAKHSPVDATMAGWQTYDHSRAAFGPDTYPIHLQPAASSTGHANDKTMRDNHLVRC